MLIAVSRNLVVSYARLLLRLFFRRIEVTGLENVPAEGGGLLVFWHPNGTIDAVVLLTRCPRPVVIGARHGLFAIPILGWMMRQVGAVPIYRRRDMKGGAPDARRPGAARQDAARQDAARREAERRDAERRAANRESIDALARAVADGGFAALFPEGQSHDEPSLQTLKTGAAHLYYRACDLLQSGSPRPVILPVGLHYDKKAIWGSRVLVTFHPPLELPAELAQPAVDEAERREQARRLTSELERILREVILATESWELHNLFQRVRKLVRAEGLARRGARSEPPDMAERVRHFGRIWNNYRRGIETHPRETSSLLSSVSFYDRCLRALGVEDHELDGATWKLSRRRTLLVLAQFLAIHLILPFFLLIGVLVNLPTMLLLQGLTKLTARMYKDEASIKLMVGALLFPLVWLGVAVLVAWGGGTLARVYPSIHYSPLLTGLVAFLLSAFGGLLALQFRAIASEVLRTLRVRIALTRRRHAVAWLLAERARLFDRFLELDQRISGSETPASPGVALHLEDAADG
jgi:1-acyl-sn-glycerol-3-phosphate acyltransferase